MAEALPHPDQCRVLLTDKRYTPDQLARHGDRFLEAGQPNVAVMFYERAKSAEGLAKVKQLAVREGDEFLLSTVARIEAASVGADDWRACAEAALAKGRFVFAREAFRKAGDEERAAKAHEQYLRIFPA